MFRALFKQERMSAFSAVLLVLGTSVLSTSAQNGVCYRSIATAHVVVHLEYVRVSDHYTYSCWWLFRCSGTQYRAEPRHVTRTVYATHRECCNGYEGDGFQCSSMFPTFCDNCESPFACVANGTCACSHPGLTGQDCTEDINECEEWAGVCEQNCTNVVGSYSCSCDSDHSLAADRRSCIGSPRDVTVMVTSSTSLRLEWQAPALEERDGTLVSFTISCSSDTLDSPDLVTTAVESPDDVALLKPFTEYTCCIYAVTNNGNSPSVCDTATTLEDTPGDAPNITVASISSKTLVVSWKPPLIPNGMLTGYRVYVMYHNGSEVDVRDVSAQNTSYYIQHLSPDQLITVAMSARTQVGEGPLSSDVSIRTSEVFRSTPYQVYVEGVHSCPQWVHVNALQKVDRLMKDVSVGIKQFCQCQFLRVYNEDGRLICDSEAPHTVVFQGRIIGTNDRNSSGLVGNLEEWVSTEPMVVVQGVQLQVVKDCPTRISQLGTLEPCSHVAQSVGGKEGKNDDHVPTSIGVSIGTTAGLIALLVTVIIILLWMRKRRNKNTPQEVSPPMDQQQDTHIYSEIPLPGKGSGATVLANESTWEKGPTTRLS